MDGATAVLDGADSLLALSTTEVDAVANVAARGLLRAVIVTARRLHLAFTGRDGTEGDVWEPAVIGLRPSPKASYVCAFGLIDFRSIRLDWLREALKQWIRGTRPATSDIARVVATCAFVSRVLQTRPGRGVAASLTLADMTAVVEAIWIARDPAGRPYSDSSRRAMLGTLQRFLRCARPAGLIEDVPGAFAVMPHHGRRAPDPREDDLTETLPEHVISQLDAHLDLLGCHTNYAQGGWTAADFAAMYQTAYVVQRDTGRRYCEVVSLRVDCLEQLAGQWNLV
jgi:hypothetical protein